MPDAQAGVDAVNVALMAPAGTVTLAGTVAIEGLPLESVTAAPPAGAAASSVTVPVDALPPVMVVGLRLKAERVVGGATVSAADLVTPPYVPEIVSEVGAETELVDTVNVAVVAPATTITLAGTVAIAALLVESVTSAPPAVAAALRDTVPLEVFPPVTFGGSRLNEASAMGWPRVSAADIQTPP